MKVLVTGGAGFIGSHITDALVGAGHEVCVLDDLSTGRRGNINPHARFELVDVRDRVAVQTVFSSFRPTVVSHQAAQTSVSVSVREPLRDAEINLIGGLNVLEAARARSVEHFVFASTGGAIYGDVPDGTSADETYPARPMSPYGCSKLAFEGYLHAYALEHRFRSTILRYANVYGPRQDPHGEAGVVAIFGERLLANEEIFVNARRAAGDEGCIRDYVFVGDVVRANIIAVQGGFETDPAGSSARVVSTVNVGVGVGTTTRELAETMKHLANSQSAIGSRERRAGDIERSVINALTFARAVGSPTSLQGGLESTIRWFQERARPDA